MHDSSVEHQVTEGTCDYRARATLGNIELPEGFEEIVFPDFTIRECPNKAQPIPIKDENGNVTDVDWVYPEKPDPRFPVCDYYLETHFSAERGYGWSEAEWLLAWCLTRLRLFKRGRLWGSLYRVNEVAHPGIRTGADISESLRRRPDQPPSPPLHAGLTSSFRYLYQIDKDSVERLRDFVGQIGKVSGKDFALAIRRFHQSFDRDLPEDQALDLFIALESLLSDDPEAVRYKIALRAAHLVGQNRIDRLNINKFLKTAYNKRSGIVHGRETAIGWLRRKSYSERNNIDELEDIVRRVLRALLEKACDGMVLKPADLDEALFFSDASWSNS